MYYSYTQGRNLYGQITNDTTTGNLSNGDKYINNDISRLLNKHSWPFLLRETTTLTTAQQQYVVIPANYKKMTSVKIQVGTMQVTPHEVPNRQFWDTLNAVTAFYSDYAQWYYIFNGRCYFYPIPATSNLTVTFFGRIGWRGLSAADYTTGTISAVTNLGTAVTGSSTSWGSGMVGKYLQITENATALAGDGEWYEITAVPGTGTLNLVKPYLGPTLAAVTNPYTIGQMSLIPDGYQEIPIYNAAAVYYGTKDQDKALYWKSKADELELQMESDYGMASDNVIVEGEDMPDIINPNLIVRLQ